MFLLSLISSVILLFFAVMYLYWGLGCIKIYKDNRFHEDDSDYHPIVAVILPLRGNDPFLVDCLNGLLNQDYLKYDVKIIVDHADDPVLEIVNQYLLKHNHPHCQVNVLENRTGICGLKNASLIQGLQDLDDKVEVIAWLDADVIPHRTWLQELIKPLQDKKVGVASGIRWYAPRHSNVGTLVRYMWNSAAVIQMMAMDIAWGGSIAMSRQVFQNPLLHESWSTMMWEDTYLKKLVSNLNLELVFVPSATMVNEESTSLKSCFHFITRQLMNVRFYHSHWLYISGLGLFSTIAQLTLMVLLPLFMVQGNLFGAGMIAVVLLFVSTSIVSIVCRIDSLIRQLVRARGEQLQRLPFSTFSVLWLTLFVYCAALFAAMRTRNILWRGVIYNAVSPFQVQIAHYEPFQHPGEIIEELEVVKSSIV
ncbi:MAG: glycosyltransferase family 2 protein [Planctomycetes bacterium]|nr:glycosyltransferase family 2 protein [Planctomycetota bacterium]MCH9727077.1 glycosyltransferase family 2 protein [Planctomycetota bacterium]MCH9775020.1 glycosyltransferase family 2 protein [Planctomycetota bacterium]